MYASFSQLTGTQTAYKNELLFSEFGINYNDLPDMFKKGSVLVRDREVRRGVNPKSGKEQTSLGKEEIVVLHVDIIKDAFWDARPQVLGGGWKRKHHRPREGETDHLDRDAQQIPWAFG